MLSTLSNNVGKFLEPVKTWRMKPLPMWQSKDAFVFYFKVSRRISLDAAQTRMTSPTNTTHCTRPLSCSTTPVTRSMMLLMAPQQESTGDRSNSLQYPSQKKLYSMGSRTSKEGTYTSCAVLTSYIESVISAGSSVISSHTTSSSSISSSISVSRTMSRGDFWEKLWLRVYLNEAYPHRKPLQGMDTPSLLRFLSKSQALSQPLKLSLEHSLKLFPKVLLKVSVTVSLDLSIKHYCQALVPNPLVPNHPIST